jgi:hypothetical protein
VLGIHVEVIKLDFRKLIHQQLNTYAKEKASTQKEHIMQSKKKGKKKNSSFEFSPQSFTYNGPIMTKKDKDGSDLKTLVLIQDVALTSTSGGLVNTTFAFENPSSCNEWSDVIAVWDEFRTLGMQVEFIPNTHNTLNTTGLSSAYAPVYCVIDRDDNTASTSYATMAQYANLTTFTLVDRFKKTMKMQGPSVTNQTGTGIVSSEGTFLNTANPPTTCGGIKFFATGLADSTSFGRFIARYRVQFRGRGK